MLKLVAELLEIIRVEGVVYYTTLGSECCALPVLGFLGPSVRGKVQHDGT